MNLSPIKKISEDYKNQVFTNDEIDNVKEILETSTDEIISDKRIKIILELNQTPSYIPALFIEKSEGAEKMPISKVFNASIVSDFSIKELAIALKNDFRNHFEMRIQLFFSLLISSYKTDFIFKKFKTYKQVGLKNIKDSCDLVEAHSCILPSLSCMTKGNFEKHFLNNDDNDGPEPFVYAANSSFQNTLNSTVKLPSFANRIDSLMERMDEKFTLNQSFRNYCVDILNLNSSGKIDPEIGLKRFLKTAEKVLNKIKSEYVINNKAGAIVLKCYLAKLENYISKTEDGSFFKLFAQNFINESSEITYKSKNFYKIIAKNFQTQIRDEQMLWKIFNELETQAYEIIGSKSITDNHALMRCCLFNLKKTTKKAEIIQASIKRIH
jgi:hypothetical protein